MPEPGPPPGARVKYSRQYRRCAKPGCPSCTAGPGHGPYWYAYWREGGQQRSHYLGKEAPPGAPSPDALAARLPAPGDTLAPPAPPGPAEAAVVFGAAPPLRVRTLGGLVVWRGGADLHVERWRLHSAVALLASLLDAPGQRLRREDLAERLWPEGEPGAGLRNLRGAAYHLRRLLGQQGADGGYLRQEGEFLRLDPAPSGEPPEDWLDARAFERAAAAALAGEDAGACRTALALYGGDYLPEEPYAEWAAARREAVAQRRLALLLHLAALCRAAGEAEEAERRLREALGADPCHEGAAQALMGLLAAQGRRAEALRVFQQVAGALDRELGLGPQPALEGLRARLLAEAAPVAADFAPRLRLPGLPTNLPAPTSSFVGRAWELGEVRRLLGEARLLTLVGPGGCGKSRLAREAAGALLGEYPDGVWLVELAPLADPALVPRAVATVLGVVEPAGRGLEEALAAFLAPRRLLLLLDNCEHLLDACAALAAALLAACPEVRVLATSQRALGLAGEVAWLVPPLTYPAAGAAPSPADLAGYEAVQLLVARARAHRPAFALTVANAGTVARLCRQLDGIPLALELAAARLGALSVAEVAARLGDRFALLSAGSRTALPRHQTLRAALGWSWELLGEGERVLLARLSVFAGGWTLAAAEAVCGDGGTLAPWASSPPSDPRDAGSEGVARVVGSSASPKPAPSGVLDLLTELVARSLGQVVEHEGQSRYHLLETVRQYALERLAAAGEADRWEERHLAYYLALAEAAEPHLRGPEVGAWLAVLEQEHDNLRTALRWAATKDRPRALHLAGQLWRFWEAHGHLREGCKWLEVLYSAAAPLPTRAAARAGAAWLAYKQGDHAQALSWAEEGVALWRQAGVPLPLARAINNLAAIESDCDHEDRAASLYAECIPLYRQAGDRWGIACALNNLGTIALGNADYEAAAAHLGEALGLIREAGDRRVLGIVLVNSAEVACGRGDPQGALALLRESLGLAEDLGDREQIAYILEGMARAQRSAEQWTETAWLGGLAVALRQALGAPPPPTDARILAVAMQAARDGLGEDRYIGLLASGRAAVEARERAGSLDYALLVDGLPSGAHRSGEAMAEPLGGDPGGRVTAPSASSE